MNKQYLFFKITLLSLLFGAINQHLQAQVSGKVFKDFNANGIQTTAAPDPIEPGLKDVTVNAYDATGTALTPVTTSTSGDYSISGGTAPYRVEFILPPSYYASKGDVSNTTVQFLATGGTANLGVNYPNDYCQANPPIATTSFINGDPTTGGTAAGFQAIVSVPYNASGKDTDGNIFNSNVIQTPLNPNKDADGSQVGSVWGLAYQRETQKLFAASFLKRHAGFGPDGIDAIYSISYSGGSPNTFVKLSAIGINVGTIPARTTLPSNAGDPSTDPDAFTAIGKKGIGDIDLSEDGKYLFLTNLNDRKVYRIFVNNPAVTPAASDVISFDPTAAVSPACSGGVVRPFGIKIWKGKIYVGMVCSAEISNNPNDLRAYIYSYDLDGTNPTKIIDFALDYTKGKIRGGGAGDKWLPWDDRLYIDTDSGNPFNSPEPTNAPQPILSDIEFDVDGSLIIGLMDRNGHMGGHRNAIPTDINQLVNVSSGGDLLRAYLSNGNYVLEAAGTVLNSNTGATQTTAGATSGQGPDNGEFYFADCIDCGADGTGGFHSELFVGGLALLPGSNEVLTTVFDPINLDSGGFKWFNNTNGAATENYELYFGASTNEPQFGKANGLGDVEILCNAQPIEIGNRVFMDTNSDGIQDAAEMGLDGIVVELWKGGTKVTDVTTTNGGEWFFTNLDADTDYEVKIVGSSFPTGKSLTTSNTASNAKDLIDNDATLVGSDAVITYKTGSAGQNNHSLDFGFKIGCSLIIASANSTNVTTCNGGNDGTAVVEPSGNAAPVTYLWSNNATTQAISGLVAGVYTVTVTETPTCTAVASVTVTEPSAVTITCSKTDVTTAGGNNGTASVTVNGGTSPYTYLWSNNATSASITGLTAATYTVTVTDANGCTKVCSSIVGEPAPAPCPVQICTPVRITKI